MKKTKQSGITLIALVITIVVLIILAGVSINLVLGENGLISNAKEAKNKMEASQIEEERSSVRLSEEINEIATNNITEQVTDKNPGKLEGEGTIENPYVINSIEDLIYFSYDVARGNMYTDKNVMLGTDLDFSSTKSYVDAFRTDYEEYGYKGELIELLKDKQGFTSIGVLYENKEKCSFYGVFNGNGHVIKNLYIKSISDNEVRVGLFANNYGTIENINIVDANINVNVNGNSGTGIVGIVSGYNYGKINKCLRSGKLNVNATDSMNTRAGGISRLQ